MKSKRETTVIEIEDTDDDDFLSQVAQAESEALSASNIKRRKITTVGFNENQENTKTTTTTIKVKDEYKNEGDYMAALKGSKSTLWQQRIKAVGSSKLPPPDYNARGGGGGGAVAPEKVCPCGLGVCNVFTANTERNRGRDFYKCPQRQESGGCGFFQWCDESPAANNGGGFGGGGSHGSVSNSVFPELQCSCGAGSCLILTSRKGDNNGKQFYKCPENQGGCGFFKWCDDNTASAGLQASAPKVYINMNDSSNKSFGARTGSSCFKCGKEGHWAKDCGMSTSDSPATFGAGSGSGSSGTCYKCGKPGHWARDCTSSQYKNVPQQY